LPRSRRCGPSDTSFARQQEIHMPHITFRSGPREGERIEIVGEATVGRENADIVIVDEEMSRRHAVLRAQGGALVVEDAGSLNGTWVDGRRIEAPTELADGAEVKMGTTVCLVEVRDPQATRLSAQPAETVEQPSAITIVGKVPTPTPSEQRTDQVTAVVATDEDAAGPA